MAALRRGLEYLGGGVVYDAYRWIFQLLRRKKVFCAACDSQKRLVYYTVILSNAKDLSFRLFTAFYITVEKILHYVLHIIIEKILHYVQNDNKVCKASLRSRRMTMKCARHRSE